MDFKCSHFSTDDLLLSSRTGSKEGGREGERREGEREREIDINVTKYFLLFPSPEAIASTCPLSRGIQVGEELIM